MANIAVGKPFFRIDGPLKVTGQMAYAADLHLPNLIWGKILRSPKAHASILHVDVGEAKKVPGVLDVMTAADLPDVLVGRRLYDMPILARQRVRYIGERVAVVAAQEVEAAEEAVERIHIEYEDLPSVFDPLEAVRASSPILHPNFPSYRGRAEFSNSDLANLQSSATWELGDVAQGFRQSDHIFEQTFKTHYVHQGYLEPHAAIVQVTSDNKVQIWASNKVPYDVKKFLCEASGVCTDKVTVNILAIGGDFGGKGSLMDIPLCYYLALRTGRPVKMVMSYAEELMAGNPRHPSVITMKTGVSKEGLIIARQATILLEWRRLRIDEAKCQSESPRRKLCGWTLSHPACPNRIRYRVYKHGALWALSRPRPCPNHIRRGVAAGYYRRIAPNGSSRIQDAERHSGWRFNAGSATDNANEISRDFDSTFALFRLA